MELTNGPEKADINNLVKNIVKILLSSSKYFHCPFCADEYLFEFTLRHHLLKNHVEDLSKIVQSPDSSIKFCDSNICPYCGALFYYISALPKHIMNSHSRDCLIKWQTIVKENSLQRKFLAEPSIKCVPCSPGISDLFEELSTGSSNKKKHRPNRRDASPLYKSALKNANRMSASRRSESWVSCDFEFTKHTQVSNSARRELQFDAAVLENAADDDAATNPGKKSKRSRKRFNLRALKPKGSLKKFVLSKFTRKYHCKIVTSTPNNFLDSSGLAVSGSLLHNQERWNRIHLD
ncbi:uncharacterized protein LOC128737753 [Sabethes cyaneus]|uniref:uncharacterized protein LOC128737753 n=1 Tax=Sabethes cyaneus TaxID=53552 RepID=UPI00237E9BBA|nr:uncharacterized protein LOC128737753 [Sabethes cyaneus]